jgi:hypothetical protein
MGCGCGRDLSPESIMDLFWKGLIIRVKDYEDIIDMIRTKKNGTGDITQKKYDLFIEALLVHPDYKEISYNLFIKFLNEARKRKNEGLFFLSLIFLGVESIDNIFKSFLPICMNQGGLKDSIIIDANNNYLINKKDLEEVISFYVEMISSMGIDIISQISDNKELFENELNIKFSDENRERFIRNEIFNKYLNEDRINIQNFLTEKLKILDNDCQIRLILTQYLNN